MSPDDEKRIAEIQQWFADRGYLLLVHQAGGQWRAPFMPRSARVGSAAFGSGSTAVAAAEDAKSEFERTFVSSVVSLPLESLQAVSTTAVIEPGVETDIAPPLRSTQSQKIEPAVETDVAPPIRASQRQRIQPAVETDTSGEVIPSEGIPTVDDEKLAQLESFGWNVAFEIEPDGGYTVCVNADDTGELIKMFKVDEFEEAWLELGIEMEPPSEEVREERERRRSRPSE